jgi:hypothetical protein
MYVLLEILVIVEPVTENRCLAGGYRPRGYALRDECVRVLGQVAMST